MGSVRRVTRGRMRMAIGVRVILNAFGLLLASVSLAAQAAPGAGTGTQDSGPPEREHIAPPAPGERIKQDLTVVGDLAPDFTLISRDGTKKITLADYRGQRPVVLIFGSYT